MYAFELAAWAAMKGPATGNPLFQSTGWRTAAYDFISTRSFYSASMLVFNTVKDDEDNTSKYSNHTDILLLVLVSNGMHLIFET